MKFKIGDKILWSAPNPVHDGIERTVVGYTSNGRVVYEYLDEHNAARVQCWNEDSFKLVPGKKEGWIIVGKEMGIPGARHASYIYPTKELAKEKYGPGIFVKVEWEE